MSQKIMVLDAEYNQPSRKTIQIGAAVYDVRSAAFHGSMEIYVNPREEITPEITALTGITNQDVKSADTILDAWEILAEFHKKHKCFRNPLVWGSGVRNDSTAIYADFCDAWIDVGRETEPPENFMGFRVIDAKTLFQSLMLFENGGYAGGLSDCMKRMGLTFEGEKHRALTDAKNTFKFWYFLTRLAHDGLKNKK
jgi:inhibitor of KinA sporulation pathway (predicted exonuclease)